MRAFLTGASGFIGGHILRLLEQQGAAVRCLVRPSSDRRNLAGSAAEIIEGDLGDAKLLERGIDGCDVVYHCAGDYRLFARRPQELYAANVQGTRNVLRAAREAEVPKVVYTSTVGTLKPSANGAIANESNQPRLDEIQGHYKRSKFLGKQEALRFAREGLAVVIVHPSAPVGDGDHKPTATGKMILDYVNGRMPAWVDTGLNLVDVLDVAGGHLLAAERGVSGEEYILGARNLPLREIFEMLAAISGRPVPRVRLPHSLMLGAAGLDTAVARLLRRQPRIPLEAMQLARYRMFFSNIKAKRDLGFDPGPVEDALKRAVDWYRANGYVRT